ncbi:MAG: hypothetical protein HRU77_06395 [Gammaproteobacteria bacterium]|nr:MAG: hypothetical protein HRU77_06395 [Gammaproteobacteria bacterium]
MVKKKTNDKTEVPVPDAGTPPALQVDEWHGMGGSYIIDQATGKRIRIEGPAVGADSASPAEQPETEQPQGEALANESE